MAKKTEAESSPRLKLNLKRTFLIGFAFFGILLLWQVYDSWCPTFLQELFRNAIAEKRQILPAEVPDTEVQYLVGIIMALDNLAALILMPIFGRLSDKTRTPLGKRMPYILVGTFLCAVAFPFIPVMFHYNNIVGFIVMMLIVLIVAMSYRNPAVALMPDLTPKPLRSKANGIINIMGYIGGFFATLVGMVFVLTDYLGDGKTTWATGNIWAIEIPFLVASVLMCVSAVVLAIKVRENELAVKLADEIEMGEQMAAVADSVEHDDEQKMSKANLTMLILILVAEFFWFMSANGVDTFMINYSRGFLGAKSSSNMVMLILGGVGSMVGFVVGGFIADKIGRKWTIFMGLALTVAATALWLALQYTGKGPYNEGTGYYDMPVYLYIVWLLKGFGMSLVHLNSFPMVVELCSKKKIGQFTGYYYAASMAAQTITPILLGLLLRIPGLQTGGEAASAWSFLPLYALVTISISIIVFAFVKNIKAKKVENAHGLEGLGAADD